MLLRANTGGIFFMENINILEIKKLKKSYKKIEAVKNVNLNVEKGDIFGFLGPNGAGKSTTIRMILGLVHPDQGDIRIKGYDIKKDYKKALQYVGTMVETPKFYDYLSGYQNLKLVANLYKNVKHVDINKSLKKVGLINRGKNKVETYSVGMKQRLGLARALLNEPELVILDEPTSGLDPQGKKEIRELIQQLAIDQGITFFICTHLLNEVEQICNKVAILQNGEIISNRFIKEKENKKWVEFYTKQKSEAEIMLKDYNGIFDLNISKNGVQIFTFEKEIEKINYQLNNSGIKVQYIIPHIESLEEYYLKETGGHFNVI